MHYLAEFQSFKTKFELNEAISSHITGCKIELTDTNLDVLDALNYHATAFPGVGQLKLSTIARDVKKSRRTVQRSIRKLEQLKIINRRPIIRKTTGAQDANLYILLPK